MKYWILAVSFLIFVVPVVGFAESQERKGQRLFAGCLKKVDDKKTLKTGQFVCKGKRDPAPFGGNGRACGDCHMPGDNFGISVDRIAGLKRDHPFFFRGLDEDQKLLRDHGLVHVNVPGKIDEFRHLREQLDNYFSESITDSELLNTKLNDIIMAQGYQDLTGQVLYKITDLLQEVEENLIGLLKVFGQHQDDVVVERIDNCTEADGPVVPLSKLHDVVAGQDEVDDLLSSLGF